MTVKELMKQLRKITKVHPEVKAANVRLGSDDHNVEFALNFVQLAKRSGKPTILLEE